MGFFSFFGTKKQQSTTGTPDFTSRSEEESQAYRDRSTRSRKKPDAGAQSTSDSALPEKKRARRRLIGAIALVLAAIIGLPMLFDSEQKSAPGDVAIQIPSMDTPAVRAPATAPVAPVPAAPAGASSSGQVSASTALSQQEEIIDPAPAAASTPAHAIAAAPASGNGVAPPLADNAPHKAVPETKPVAKQETKHEPKPEFKPEPKPQTKSEAKPEPKPESKHAVKIDETARAKAILEGRPDSVEPEKTASKFTLQVAALASQEKVDELQGKLKEAGIKSYTQKVATQSGARIRVRVGPFASKEEAEKMRAKLAKLGFGGALVPVS